MPETFDGEKAGKEAIATSPEITEGVDMGGDTSGQPEEARRVKSEIEGIDYQPDTRNARLLALTLQQWDKNKRLDKAQIDAAEEIGAEGFGAFNAAPLPRFAKLSVTLALLLLSIVPLALDISGAINEPGEDEKNGSN